MVGKYGWSKAAMGGMRALDSILKESQRVSTSAAGVLFFHFSIGTQLFTYTSTTVGVRRQTLHDFTFSNGTTIPAGIIIASSPLAVHFNASSYTNPNEFDAFRSFRKREKEGEGTKHQMVALGSDYIAFGVGKHAWYEPSFLNSWLHTAHNKCQ